MLFYFDEQEHTWPTRSNVSESGINHSRGWEEGLAPAAAATRSSVSEAGINHNRGREEGFILVASRAYLLVLSLVVIWTAGALIAPIGIAHGWVSADQSPVIRADGHFLPDLLAVILHAAYGKVCHQMPERSLWIQGHPMAVCARCFGIYLGYLAGLLVYPLAYNRLDMGLPRRRWLILALLPISIDFLGGYLGLFENTLASRTATGLIAGIACAIYTAAGLIAATGAALAAISDWINSLPLRERGGTHNA